MFRNHLAVSWRRQARHDLRRSILPVVAGPFLLQATQELLSFLSDPLTEARGTSRGSLSHLKDALHGSR